MSDAEWITQYNEDALMADGFEGAIIGVAERCSQPTLVVYDAQRCIEILMEQGMSEEEAEEFFSFNTLGAWMGENTPLFLWRKPRTAGETQTLRPRDERPNHNGDAA